MTDFVLLIALIVVGYILAFIMFTLSTFYVHHVSEKQWEMIQKLTETVELIGMSMGMGDSNARTKR